MAGSLAPLKLSRNTYSVATSPVIIIISELSASTLGIGPLLGCKTHNSTTKDPVPYFTVLTRLTATRPATWIRLARLSFVPWHRADLRQEKERGKNELFSHLKSGASPEQETSRTSHDSRLELHCEENSGLRSSSLGKVPVPDLSTSRGLELHAGEGPISSRPSIVAVPVTQSQSKSTPRMHRQ